MPEKNTEAFVGHICEMVSRRQNTGYAAKMKKADNETSEAMSWELLAPWTNLEDISRTRAYGLIGAAVARAKNPSDGEVGLGKALRLTVDDKTEIEKSAAASRLRRLLACQDRSELLRILRSTLRFIAAKEIPLDYSRLLDETLWFDSDRSRERTRARWAMEFFGKQEEG